MKQFDRQSGILLPIFSLPGGYGIGSLGKAAYEFVDYLSACGCTIWQLLPLNVTSYGDSPYQSPSSVGLNYYFIDLDILIEKKLLTIEEVEASDYGGNQRKIDYAKLFNGRVNLLKKAFSRFKKNSRDFIAFEKKGQYRDFAFYMTLKEINDYKPYYEWDESYSEYSQALENLIINDYSDTYLFYVWTQYEFRNQYFALKQYANSKNIYIMGDLPLYLARDSVECYKYPKLFQFDENHNPTVVAGCPPDVFTEDGQLWGNPIYDWKEMKKDGYSWFRNRIAANFELFDIVRIDHFRGLAGYYAIPYGMKDAKIGEWVEGPGYDLFDGICDRNIVAEDLGYIDQPVIDLMNKTGFPGMKIMEFAFDGDPSNSHRPSTCGENSIIYTGTHDNMPLMGYLKELSPQERENYRESVIIDCFRLGVDPTGDTDIDLARHTIELGYACKARYAIYPMQDLKFFGEEARLNLPSTISDHNWTFRCVKEDFDDGLRNFIVRNREAAHRDI